MHKKKKMKIEKIENKSKIILNIIPFAYLINIIYHFHIILKYYKICKNNNEMNINIYN